MQITDLWIRNFKSIKDMHISGIENALILVGKNDTGKTAVLDAIRAVGGDYEVREEDFQENFPNIEIMVTLQITETDLQRFHKYGIVSSYRRYEAWYRDFCKKLPSFQNGELTFEYSVNREGRIRFSDGHGKNNSYIPRVFPHIYYMDTERDLERFQDDLLMLQEDDLLKQMRAGCCMFDMAKECNHCFSCIGLVSRKTPEELNAFEAAKLLEYKLYNLNLDTFSGRVNETFRKNGGRDKILYSMNLDVEKTLAVTTEIQRAGQKERYPVGSMGKGMRSIYMLSLLETYEEEGRKNADLILVEDPEIFLHPKLQRVSGDILYRLSKKNQVIFSTHSPNLLSNFNSRQIRQVFLNAEGVPEVREKTDISAVLDDLGYSANDLMNVNFVFIVEGKQDKSRLPLLIRKYYSETYDSEGNLSRIAIITTNSCTNIKTYANLKYMNQVYIKDNFLMIRDGDGKDREELKRQLCSYYARRNEEDADRLPRVTEKNVLILRYYSFENYFLDPKVMAEIGILESEEQFYQIFLEKWKEYLHRLKSGQKLREVIGKEFESEADVKEHMEEIKIHMRGHNLYDIYYGRYKQEEQEILTRYIDVAPREDFADILDSIDRFIYFESRKKSEDIMNEQEK
ncbi:AAA family ATPase [Mediterraneibacter glycyrrhizinilyticus]|uniref:ATP-dependent nuclease n=1 Tax=Mediterraneibacter glycyrrhizinilyticus TaxID=342942 RepID=UPI001961F84B|nr:AAA family ATPase [Mediterraneibacter glycyrrhizinilyticus]MBM6749908.1 AAA family ATPase [Mediterraneibacter glycyrrhizinilyticus]